MPTGIEWTDETWNPVRARLLAEPSRIGWHCEHKSPGCKNCYAETLNRAGRSRYTGTKLLYKPGHRDDVEIFVDDKKLREPLHWRRPRAIFVCSMTDLFADFVSDDMIDRVFAIMALCPQHTFQVLTKRPDRMRAYLSGPVAPRVWRAARALGLPDKAYEAITAALRPTMFPLPNVWLGTSVEDQERADERIPALLATPAAVRFLSCEPLLGPVNLHFGLTLRDVDEDGTVPWVFDRSGSLHWVICGGESGPNARPMHPDWARSLRDQCGSAGVPFFFKQWGSHRLIYDRDVEDPDWKRVAEIAREHPKGRWLNLAGGHGFHGERVVFVERGHKKEAGRLLDGFTHDGMPEFPA